MDAQEITIIKLLHEKYAYWTSEIILMISKLEIY